jgi:tetrapyrrole methylase family protein/MazG family protein|tara:strand:- start:2535 stop:3968 length:1434 start_codon:yes stop_codon:yes gene_type:complete
VAPTVTIVGLGPAGSDLATTGTLEAIAANAVRFVRTSRHPAVTLLGDVTTLDHHYEAAASFDEVYTGIVDEVVAAASEAGSVLYAVPGSPMVAERTVEMLIADDRVDTVVLPALSFADLAWTRLGTDPLTAGVRIVDAHRFAVEAAGERGPMLVAQVDTDAVLADVVASVPDPPAVPVTVLQGLGTADELIRTVPWDSLCDEVQPDHLTCMYIPEMAPPIAVEVQRFVEQVATLRAECPWDAEQTHTSLRPHLIEEAYEVLEALDAFDEETGDGSDHLEEELGDLLFQVVFHARIAADDGRFDLADVARGIHDKLRRRHPHVFPESGGPSVVADDADAVISNWDRIKSAEKGRSSSLDGIPPALPALAMAQKVIRRSRGTGVAPDVVPVAPDLGSAGVDDEHLGDALMALAAWAAENGIDAEDALRDAIGRFADGVRAAEALAAAEGVDLAVADEATRARYRQQAGGSVGSRETGSR